MECNRRWVYVVSVLYHEKVSVLKLPRLHYLLLCRTTFWKRSIHFSRMAIEILKITNNKIQLRLIVFTICGAKEQSWNLDSERKCSIEVLNITFF